MSTTMNIDSIQPIRLEGVAPVASSEQRHMLPSKGKGSDTSVPAGNTADAQETDKTLKELGQAVERFNVSLKFTKDQDTGKIVIEMIDQTSGETLLQIPNEATLHLAANLSELQGKIFNCL